ncbi:MAG: VWA domain-containing protein [Flavobacteriales bacterium]
MKFYLAFILTLSSLSVSLAQADTTRILFVFDASNSMNAYWQSEPKIDAAVRLLSKTVDELKYMENVEMGLRVYGHQTKFVTGQQDCDDTQLLVRIGKGKNIAITNALKRIQPKGTTPIARSLEKAAEDFPQTGGGRNIIILITDGIEACDEDPCAVSLALQKKGIILKPFIIGIGVDPSYTATFECVGNYFDASKEEIFEQVIKIVISQALNNTSYQVDLTNEADEAVYTNVPMTIMDENSGEVVQRFVHTLNKAGNPDTLTLDPLGKYTLRVHTIPEVITTELTLEPGQHNHWKVKVPQGNLSLNFSSGRSEYEGLQYRLIKPDDCDYVHHSDFGMEEQIISGIYNIELLTNPPTLLTNVEITEGELNDIILPAPGTINLRVSGSGYGGIFTDAPGGGKLVKKFSEGNPSGRYILQPGKYKVIYRSRQAKQTIYTFEKEFTITSSATVNVEF